MDGLRFLFTMPLLLIGCVLAATGLILLRRSLLYTATATVREVTQTTVDGKTSYTPLLQFTTRDKQTIELRPPTSTTHYEVGETVSVFYDPTFPTIAQPVSPIRLWILPGVFALMGLALAFAGATNLSVAINSLPLP